jgi:membrane-associated protease RseP (regulator of RpoE activity)
MNHKRRLANPLVTIVLLSLTATQAYSVTKVFSEGDMSLVRDSKASQYGALKILDIEPDANSIVYRWYLLPKDVYDLSASMVRTGTVETSQVQGRAVVAFGPFVMEWHATGGDKGMLSANGNLGVQPLMVASSALKFATQIKDVRSGFRYEEATPREAPDPLGLQERFAKMPKARLGLGVAETFADIGLGVKERALQIARIDDRSNAYEAGLRKGHCILAFDGEPVMSLEDFQNRLQNVRPEDTVLLTVFTGEETVDIAFPAGDRITKPDTRPTPVVDPDASPEDQKRIEANEEVRELMDQTLEALKAVYYD